MRSLMTRWINRAIFVAEMMILKDCSNASTVNMPIVTPIAIRDSTQISPPRVTGTVSVAKNCLEIR